jgi:hypothetical protein
VAALSGHWGAFPSFLAAGSPMLVVALAAFLIGIVSAGSKPRLAEEKRSTWRPG